MRLSLRGKHFLGVLSLVNLITANIIPYKDPSRAFIDRLTRRDNPPWPYAVIGDSWGSGVSYNQDVLYDNNLDNCLRTKESHGPQMEADTTWTGSFSSGLRDAACSGSQLVDLAKGNYQMGKVGQPDVVIMTSGGNNCGFGTIVDVCIYHSSPTTNYGPAYADDTDGSGACAQALNNAKNYITNTLQQDLVNTINDILADPNVKSNPDFLLYLTGYAQFFGTDYDPWCNTEHWNVVGISPTPYLSIQLRTAFNNLVSKVNQLYHDTIQQTFSKQARFIDLDTGFGGHRFCEPGASHSDQVSTDTNFDGVYLWNLNWPWQVANTPAPNPDEQNGNISSAEAQQLFGNDGVTAWSGSGGGGNVPSNGWRLRPFHPRYSGYTSIKEAILAQLKADGLPKAENAATPTSSSSPPSSSTPPPYATGTCSFHLDEWQDCADDSSNLFASITMYDNNKATIGQTNINEATSPLGDPINVSDPLQFNSTLPYPLIVTGEHENDYVQFNYNGLSFTSRDTSGQAKCTLGGWNPRDGPVCTGRAGNQNAVSMILIPLVKGSAKLICWTGEPDGLFVPMLDAASERPI